MYNTPRSQLSHEKDEKVEKHMDLASAMCIEQHVKTRIIPAIIGAMYRLAPFFDRIDIPNIISNAQISVIKSIARILRDELSL